MCSQDLNVRVAGRYTLVRRLDGGAFGEIYLATCDVSGSRVAVKLVTVSSNPLGREQTWP